MIVIIVSSSCLSSTIYEGQQTALAQPLVQTVKYRNMIIDLGNGIKTNAQLTLPAIGKGPFPSVLLIPGSAAEDMNYTAGFIHVDKKTGQKIYPPTPFFQIAQYLSKRGFAVLRYDKRGTGTNHTILDSNVWGNLTVNNLIEDANKALAVLINQSEVDANKITVLGHSEGTVIAPRVAIDNPSKAKNIVLMGAVAQNMGETLYFQTVNLPILYAQKVLDKNHTGMISIQQIAKDPLPFKFLVPYSILLTNNTKVILTTLTKEFGTSGYVSIDKQLYPLLIKSYIVFPENLTGFNSSKCNNLIGCRIWWRSELNLKPTLNIIVNISKSISILILNGKNDSQTPVQQALLLQQRLTEVNHPDHTLITYPNLGHSFYPSSQWSTGSGAIEQYVLADLFAWLEAHSRLRK